MNAQKADLDALFELEALSSRVNDLGPVAGYLSQAELALPGGHPWIQRGKEIWSKILARIIDRA